MSCDCDISLYRARSCSIIAYHVVALPVISYNVMACHGMSLHCIALHCIALHCISGQVRSDQIRSDQIRSEHRAWHRGAPTRAQVRAARRPKRAPRLLSGATTGGGESSERSRWPATASLHTSGGYRCALIGVPCRLRALSIFITFDNNVETEYITPG